MSLNISYVWVMGEESTYTIVESYRNKYPTGQVVSPEIRHLKYSLCPDYLRQFKRGVLSMDHMAGAEPFPWPIF